MFIRAITSSPFSVTSTTVPSIVVVAGFGGSGGVIGLAGFFSR